MPDIFIVEETESKWWVLRIDTNIEEGQGPYQYEIKVTPNRSKAAIYRGEEGLEFWQKQEGYRIVEIGQDELMSRLGQSRLEGF